MGNVKIVKTNKFAYRRRSVVAFCAIIGLFIYASGFLVFWQLVRGEEFQATVQNQSLWTTELTANRGTIYDSTGKVLAQSASVWTVVLEPVSISGNLDLDRTEEETKELIASELARILDMDEDTILAKTEQNSYYVYVKRKVEDSVKDEILEFIDEYDIGSGIRLVSDYKRYYPYNDLASSVIGFTGTDNEGLYGIELQYEDELSGTTGMMVSMKTAVGGDMPFQYEQYIESENGYDLYLTIDETVQSICEQYLNEAIEKYDAQNGGTVIVMNVNTGAIIAMASGNSFDLNDPFTVADEETVAEIELLPDEEQSAAYSTALYAQWRNTAISDTYYPGSVFKMITASSALDSGSITEYTVFECTGTYSPASNASAIACWINPYGGSHGLQTVVDALCNSCNPFFMQTAEAMGASTFFDYFEAFGFAEKTGIDLPGEASSIYYDEDELGPVELATESFGQNFSITPIQMVVGAAAVANGGYIVTPYVVDKMVDSDGNIVSTTETEIKRQVISADVSEYVTEALIQNVESGTASTGSVVGYEVAGKTGTSEKIAKYNEDGGAAAGATMYYVASFCGYAPADDPEYVVLVYLDEPTVGTASGASQAGPTFASIMSEILPYLGVEQELDESEYEDLITETPTLTGLSMEDAITVLKSKGLDYEIYTEDGISTSDYNEKETVVMQIPSSGSDMPVDGTVILSTLDSVSTEHMTAVPDFVGLTLSECYAAANEAGLQLIVYGTETSGELLAQTQSEISSKVVKPGTVVEITMAKFSGTGG